ncbi:hypothetical protein [Neobacillus cucumis]|jgi:hypothetical protein|uniref:hypothetical protein n=1 Tax=Neobacillus cucumis TaxID=1740721 RepID=UPI002E1D3F26|nr:hypothetical protein [Neobacillus cucumis]
MSVLNEGITGNRILSDSPNYEIKALERLDRDVFNQTGVTDVILVKGINDISDFSKLLLDPNNPLMLNPKYDSGDHLHASDPGYKAMDDFINLSMPEHK